MNTFITAKENNITEPELAAILLFYYTKNAAFSWMSTIGINNISPNKKNLASQWFKTAKIQNAIHFVNKELENEMGISNSDPAKDNFDSKLILNNPDPGIDITSENIKDILQSEFRKISDPDKRAVILMKIADFVGLKNSDADDPLTPTIYLPARCSTCNLLKNNQQTNPL